MLSRIKAFDKNWNPELNWFENFLKIQEEEEIFK